MFLLPLRTFRNILSQESSTASIFPKSLSQFSALSSGVQLRVAREWVLWKIMNWTFHTKSLLFINRKKIFSPSIFQYISWQKCILRFRTLCAAVFCTTVQCGLPNIFSVRSLWHQMFDRKLFLELDGSPNTRMELDSRSASHIFFHDVGR